MENELHRYGWERRDTPLGIPYNVITQERSFVSPTVEKRAENSLLEQCFQFIASRPESLSFTNCEFLPSELCNNFIAYVMQRGIIIDLCNRLLESNVIRRSLTCLVLDKFSYLINDAKWKKFVDNLSFFSNIVILNLRAQPLLTPANIIQVLLLLKSFANLKITANMTNLSVLDLSYCNRLTSHSLESVVAQCKNLISLRFERCLKVSESLILESKSIQLISACVCSTLSSFTLKNTISLTSLDISDCSSLTLLKSTSELPLKNLNLFGCRKLDGSALVEFTKKSSEIKELNMFGLMISANEFQQALANVRCIEELVLTDCKTITDSCLSAISGDIKILMLNSCSNVTDNGLIQILPHLANSIALNLNRELTAKSILMIADNCEKLTSIDLAENLNIDSNCVSKLIEKCIFLRNLSIEDCTKVFDDAFDLDACRSNIQNLNLAQVPIHDRGLTRASAMFINLEAIDLYGNKLITDTGIESLVKSCPKLREIILEWCVQLSDDSIMVISENCKSLQKLDVYGCGRLTEVPFSQLLQSCTTLQELNVPWLIRPFLLDYKHLKIVCESGV